LALLERLFFVVFVIFSFFVWRVVFVSLLLSNSLLDSSNAVSYILVEFPVLLYFIFVSNYVVIWAFLKRNSKKLSAMQQNLAVTINAVIVAFNSFIFFLCILILILYVTIVRNPQYTCGGAVAILDTQTAFSLQIAYRATFSLVAIVLGVSLLYTGYSFSQLMKKMSGVKARKRYEILAIAVVGSAGLIAQAIDLIVVTAGRFQQSNYISLSILIVVEIIPALIFLLLIDIKKSTEKAMASTRMSKSASRNSTMKSRSEQESDDGVIKIPYRE